jgi:hypothetical protein
LNYLFPLPIYKCLVIYIVTCQTDHFTTYSADGSSLGLISETRHLFLYILGVIEGNWY